LRFSCDTFLFVEGMYGMDWALDWAGQKKSRLLGGTLMQGLQ